MTTAGPTLASALRHLMMQQINKSSLPDLKLMSVRAQRYVLFNEFRATQDSVATQEKPLNIEYICIYRVYLYIYTEHLYIYSTSVYIYIYIYI